MNKNQLGFKLKKKVVENKSMGKMYLQADVHSKNYVFINMNKLLLTTGSIVCFKTTGMFEPIRYSLRSSFCSFTVFSDGKKGKRERCLGFFSYQKENII